MPQNAKRYLAYIDVLNIVASLAVVILHLNYCVWMGPSGPAWKSAILIETLFYWPVPIFFMLTGTTLIDYRKRMDTREFFRRRFLRTVVPWLAWSLIGLLFACFSAKTYGTVEMPKLDPLSIFNGITQSSYVEFYWFFPALFAMYLSLPLLSAVQSREEVFPYLIAAGILFNGVMPLLNSFFDVYALGSFAPPAIAGYTCYVLIGYQLSHWESTRTQRMAIYAAGIAGWLVQLLGTMAVSSPSAGFQTMFRGQHSPFAVAQAVAIYVLVQHVDFNALFDRLPTLGKVVHELAGLTFGVYLMHWFPLKLAQYIFMPDPTILVFRLGGAVVLYVVCAAFSYVFKRIPVLKNIVP